MMTTAETESELTLLAARTSRRRADAKLLSIRPEGFAHHTVRDLAKLIQPSNLIVVNDAATMPSQFVGTCNQQTVQIRLALHLGGEPKDVKHWMAVSIGNAEWTTRTEDREPGYSFRVGDVIEFSESLCARVVRVVGQNGRLIELSFYSTHELFTDLFTTGVPIQYAHLDERLEDWDQQTIFSGPAVAVEPPSSAFHLSWKLMLELKQKGVEFATLTHATGLSTTGDEQLDRCLPLPELSIISADAADAINRAKRQNRRVIGIGTGVTRAIESNARNGEVAPGTFTSLGVLSRENPPQIVNGLLSGLHEPGTSHMKLLEAFLPSQILEHAYRSATSNGYLGHEYGDLELVLAK